jgi:YidC/Oxa1 family membrane protein insertase
MGFISSIFHTFLYQPLFNLLVLLYVFIPGRDFGLTIILLTVLIKVLLYPIGAKAIRSQRAFSKVQPIIKEIQEKYKEDKERQVKEIMDTYKREKINPFSPLFALVIQLPILFALYWVFWQGFQPSQMINLYDFIPNPGQINPSFLGIINLDKPNWIFAALAAVLQFVQAKTAVVKNKADKTKKQDIAKIMEKQMIYFLPFFTFIILLKLPSAIGLYWIVSTLFTIVQQYILTNSEKKELA